MYLKRVRELREANNLSQRQLSELLGMPQSQYNRYERGLRDFPTATLIQLVQLFKTSADYILELSDCSDPTNQKPL